MHLAAWEERSGVVCSACMRIRHIRRRYVILQKQGPLSGYSTHSGIHAVQ